MNRHLGYCRMCYKDFGQHETVYHFARGDGTVDQYHMHCFGETTQGKQGFKIEKVTVDGNEVIPKTL